MTDTTRALEALAKLESHARVSAGDEGAKRIAATIRAALGEAGEQMDDWQTIAQARQVIIDGQGAKLTAARELLAEAVAINHRYEAKLVARQNGNAASWQAVDELADLTRRIRDAITRPASESR
jgi:hypothetical protein